LDAAASTLGSRAQGNTKALWDGWEEKGLRAGGYELGAGDWEEKAVAPVRKRPLHQMERRLLNQTMQQHSLPSFSGYLRGRSKGFPGGGRLGRPSPPSSPSPSTFLPHCSPKSTCMEFIYLPGRSEGQQMTLPVTRTSFGLHLRHGPISQYLQGPAGLNFPVELHALKGQRVLFDVSCAKWKRSEIDGQPRELWISVNPDTACGVEEHEKQQAETIAAWAPPPKPVGRPRKLPVLEAGTRENTFRPSNGGRGRGRARGRGAELINQRCPWSQSRSCQKKTQICISIGCYDAGRECQMERVCLKQCCEGPRGHQILCEK